MSWVFSPVLTPSKMRRPSTNSEYETAGEDDDGDASMYYSMTDMERTMENKENSVNISSNSAKRLANGASAKTPLIRKTLEKALVKGQAALTPQNKAQKHVSFNVKPNIYKMEVNNRPEATTSTSAEQKTAETEMITKYEIENHNASAATDDMCDVTVVETGAAPAPSIESNANNEKSVSHMITGIKLIVTDFDEPNKKPILVAQVLDVHKRTEKKNVSRAITRKTLKTANVYAAVLNSRLQLAAEMKKTPKKNARISICKRSSMYQPRKSSGRRSIEAMIVAKANQSILKVEAAFAEDTTAVTVPSYEMLPPTAPTSSEYSLPAASASAEALPPNVGTSVQEPLPTVSVSVPYSSIGHATESSLVPKEQTNNATVNGKNQRNALTASSNATNGKSAAATVKQTRISLAPVRKPIAPRLSIFSISSAFSSSAAARAQRRQTKNNWESSTAIKSETMAREVSFMPQPMPSTSSNARKSSLVKATATDTSASLVSKEGKFVRPADVRPTIMGGGGDGNAFKCHQCTKLFAYESQLKVHTNNFHNLAKKSTSSAGKSNAANALKCRFCDKQFDKEFALTKHMQENCTKIQPAERKRMFAETMDRNKNKSSAAGNKNKNTKPNINSKSTTTFSNSARLTRLLTDLIGETRPNGDGQRKNIVADEKRLRLSLGHSGVYRTPTKSIKCKVCNTAFMDCVRYAEHSLLHDN